MSIYLKQVILENWMCYRGRVVLDLKPTAYAVTARRLDNQERSNYSGKSALFEAIHFALDGSLNKDRHQGVEGWLTDGAKEGGVELHLSTGEVIRRTRKRGSSTQVEFRNAKKDHAQALIDQFTGVAGDFTATSYFQQRKMARLVLADAGERMKLVSSWIDLAPLEQAEELLSAQVADVAWKTTTARGKLQFVRDTIAAHPPEETLALHVRECDSIIADTRKKLDDVAANVRDAFARIDAVKLNDSYQTALAERDAAARNAKLPKTTLAELAKCEATWKDLRGVVHLAKAELRQKQALASGEFDGKCPVAGIACPAKESINADAKKNQKLLAKAEAVYSRHAEQEQTAESQVTRLRDEVQHARTAQIRFEMHDKRCAELSARITDMPPEVAVLDDASIAQLESDMRDATRLRAEYQAALKLVKEAAAEESRIVDELAGAEQRLTIVRRALTIFGKAGAQRRIAERAVAAIQRGANDMLQESGIDLSVDIQWSHEGSDLARACTCGHPFPKSAREKTCERCGEPRGLNIIHRLDVLLSEQSGAAEDLAGASMQLSASAWLRNERGVRWSVAMIDEPFSQLDAANRRAFSTHLAAMLKGRYGFEQAFVISHSSDVNHTFPARIEICSDGKFSTMKVIE